MQFYSFESRVTKSYDLLGNREALQEIAMSQDHNHLNHATWECKYHVVFTPKYRKKPLLGKSGGTWALYSASADANATRSGSRGARQRRRLDRHEDRKPPRAHPFGQRDLRRHIEARQNHDPCDARK